MANPFDATIRAVFDSNVLLQAMSNANGPAGACFQAVRDQQIQLCASRDLIREFEDIVTRPILVQKLRLTANGTSRFAAEFKALAQMIDPVSEIYRHPVDPKDTMIVNLAIAADAAVITSRDRHLLDLRDPSQPVGIDFMSRFASIEVLTPLNLLQRLRRR